MIEGTLCLFVCLFEGTVQPMGSCHAVMQEQPTAAAYAPQTRNVAAKSQRMHV
jgi:hypothetical protein